MTSRMGWIAVSYVTRPLVLALAGMGVVFLIAGMIPQPIRTNEWVVYPSAPSVSLMVDSKATLEEVRRSGREREVDGIDMPKLWIDLEQPKIDPAGRPYHSPPEAAFYEILQEFPNLRRVHFTQYGVPTGMDRIVSLAQLETLLIDGYPFFDLAPLRSLGNLRRLEIGLSDSQKFVHGVLQPPPKLEGIGALASLPKLDTLVLGTSHVINDAVLADVGLLPHLSTLVLDLADVTRTRQSITKAGFHALARAPALQTLYVGGRLPDDYLELAALAKASAPRLRIYSSRHDSKTTMPFVVLMPCFWFALAIGIQLSHQYIGFGSRLVPGFAASHALVGVVLSAGVIALGAARLMTNGFAGPSAIAASAALVTSIVALGSATRLTGRALRPRGFQRLTWISSVLWACIFVSLFNPAFDAQTSVLNTPIAVVGYALAACGATVLTVWTLAHLVEWSSSSSGPERKDPKRNQWRASWLLTMVSTKRRERKIEDWSPAPNANWWHRVGRWRLGNPASTWLMMVLATLTFAATMSVIMLVITRLTGTRLWGSSFPFVFGAGFIVFGTFGQAVTMWRARLLVLPMEFLRPYSRRAMQRELAAAFALDLLPSAILIAIVATLGIHLGTSISLPWQWVPLSFLCSLTLGGSWTLASTALLVLVRRRWVSIVVLTALLTANLFGVFGLVRLQIWPHVILPRFMTPGLVFAQFGLPILTAVIVDWMMWRRWLTIEIGQHD